MDKFSLFWDTEVKPVALKCIDGRSLMLAEGESIGHLPEGDEKEHAIVAFNKKYGDVYGINVISSFVFDIEHDLADGRLKLNGLNSLMMVKGCLAADNTSYWTNVWKNDLSSERAQNFLKLGELAAKLIDLRVA